MRKNKIISLILAAVFSATLFVGCDSKNAETSGENVNTAGSSDHPVITMNAPYRNMSQFYNLVHEKYPEINLQIEPYNGQNMTAYVFAMRNTDEMPDIYFTTYYFPGRYDDKSDFLNMSAYDFTDNFTQSRLREVTYDNGVYMLPLGYNALGITYNKTLLEKNGWTLPTNLKELEELKTKVEEAGYIFCRNQLQFPGYGYQYLCNILDTGFLSTISGMSWQNKFLNGEATVAGTPEMMENLQLLERWRDIGMLNGDGTPDSDQNTKLQMVEGNTLFLVGNSNDLSAETDCEDDFRLMPYLSEDGNHNVFILNVSRYVGLNKELGEDGNEKKLEDALKVMDVLSTVEGLESLEPNQNNSRLLALKDATVSEDSFYSDILDELNSGHTAGFIYTGWENAIVPVGEKMIDFACGRTDIDDVIKCFDENQHLITENDVEKYTKVTDDVV